MKHRLKIIREIFVNPIALGLGVIVAVASSIPLFIGFVSWAFVLNTELSKGIMEGLLTFIESYKIYFCISPFIVIPLILAEGMYRKAKRFLGESITISHEIINNRNTDYKSLDKKSGNLLHETSLDLIFINKELVDINIYANFVSFFHISKSGEKTDVLKKVNPNNSNVGWNGNKVFNKITIGRNGKESTLNIVRSKYPYISHGILKFFDDIQIPSDEGIYEFEISINGDIDGNLIDEIIYKDYFVISKRSIMVGKEEISFGDSRIIQDEEILSTQDGEVEFVRFGFVKPVLKTEFL